VRRISGETGENLGEPGTICGAVSVRYPTSSIESRFVGIGLVAADDASSRLVYAMVFALIIIGVVLIVLAVVVFRRTRVDLAVLAPLERMGSRKWRKADTQSRREFLDAVRPPGATGPSPRELEAAPADLPPPVIASADESPHEATFVAGPDGVEPVEHVEAPEPVEDPETAGDAEAVSDAAVASAETIEPDDSEAAPVAADESADADVVPAEAMAVEEGPAEVVPIEEPAGSDAPFAAPDVPVAAPDVPVAAPDDVGATPEGGLPAPDFAPDDHGASADDLVDAPTAPAEPVDDPVTGQ
jgi:hypothetical protein